MTMSWRPVADSFRWLVLDDNRRYALYLAPLGHNELISNAQLFKVKSFSLNDNKRFVHLIWPRKVRQNVSIRLREP
jgi:hypothetical protein